MVAIWGRFTVEFTAGLMAGYRAACLVLLQLQLELGAAVRLQGRHLLQRLVAQLPPEQHDVRLRPVHAAGGARDSAIEVQGLQCTFDVQRWGFLLVL